MNKNNFMDKNTQYIRRIRQAHRNPAQYEKGFIIPLIIGIVAVLIIAGAYLVYKNESGQGEESDQASGQFLASTTTNYTSATSSSTSTSTQPAPVITSINPSSGPIGTIVELKGNNLAGFEGELSAWIDNSNGEKAFLPGIGSVPRADQTIRVQIDSQLCKFDYGMKGEPVGGCTSYLTITPGTYKIYTYPWGNMSNTVQFIVTASNSQVNSSQPSITVLSPTSGTVGTSVTITGSGFAATGNTISFGDWQSPNVSSSNRGTSITFTVPNVALCYSDNGPTACQTYIAGSRVPATYNVQVSTSIVIGKTSNVLPFHVTAPASVSTSQPSITVTSPNGGETWIKGTTQYIKWTDTSNALNQTGDIKLEFQVPACALPTAPVRCMIAVHAPLTIATGVNLNSGSYAWNVGAFTPPACQAGYVCDPIPVYDGQYKIQICPTNVNNSTQCDDSNNYFTIASSTTSTSQPSITVLSPNGGEIWSIGSIQKIRWSSSNNTNSSVNIELISRENCSLAPCPMSPPPGYKGPISPLPTPYVAKDIPNTKEFSWKVGQYLYNNESVTANSGEYRVQICYEDKTNLCGSSNNYFTITN